MKLSNSYVGILASFVASQQVTAGSGQVISYLVVVLLPL